MGKRGPGVGWESPGAVINQRHLSLCVRVYVCHHGDNVCHHLQFFRTYCYWDQPLEATSDNMKQFLMQTWRLKPLMCVIPEGLFFSSWGTATSLGKQHNCCDKCTNVLFTAWCHEETSPFLRSYNVIFLSFENTFCTLCSFPRGLHIRSWKTHTTLSQQVCYCMIQVFGKTWCF